MKILMAGDIVGSPGRRALAQVAGKMKQAGTVDFVVANAENAAAGKGLTGKLAEELFAAGADVLTLGDHAWDQKDMAKVFDAHQKVTRPANYAPGCPGRGWVTIETEWGTVTVINLVGRVFMGPCDCPFRAADSILKSERQPGRIILVDFHAEATSEKIAMGRYLDGRVTAVAGTHTHVQTSDERILPKGTAYITDLGMTGPFESVIGCSVESVMPVFLTGMKNRFEVADQEEEAVLEGMLLDVDDKTGKARGIKRIRK